MTAREFLDYCGLADTRENRALLTSYVAEDGIWMKNGGLVDFGEFPDADVPDWLLLSSNEPAGFQEFVDANIFEE